MHFVIITEMATNLETIELSVKSFKEGRNRGVVPSLGKPSVKSSLVHHVSEPVLKIG